MQQKLISLLFRWLLNSLGIYLAVSVFGTGYAQSPESAVVFLIAGLMFSLVSTFLRPFAIIFSLPILIFTFGFFVIVVNGLMVYLAAVLTPYLQMTFFHSILAGVVITLVNYIVNTMSGLQLSRRLREV